MSTQIAFTLYNTRIRCEVSVSLYGSREEWRVLKDGTVVAYCATEDQAHRVKAELDALAARILDGELDASPNARAERFICNCGCGGVDRCRADDASALSSCAAPDVETIRSRLRARAVTYRTVHFTTDLAMREMAKIRAEECEALADSDTLFTRVDGSKP